MTNPIIKIEEHKRQIIKEIRERQEYLQGIEGLRKKFPRALTAEYVWEKMLLRRQKGEQSIPTGVQWWDEWAGPFRRGNTYVLAGYAGAGKTTLALNLAWSMAKRGVMVWYYCLELSSDEVFEVLGGHVLGRANITPDDEALAYSIIQPTGFRFFESDKYLPWDKHLELIHDEVRKAEIQFVVIDNLSFLTRVARNTFEVESVASAKIKALSQELDIPILLIHHLRKPESDSAEPEPTAHSMRGSGAILADASDAFILHHPLIENEQQSRHQVGYILSGKPRWGMGGKRYVYLNGGARKYGPASAIDYPKQQRRRKKYDE